MKFVSDHGIRSGLGIASQGLRMEHGIMLIPPEQKKIHSFERIIMCRQILKKKNTAKKQLYLHPGSPSRVMLQLRPLLIRSLAKRHIIEI